MHVGAATLLPGGGQAARVGVPSVRDLGECRYCPGFGFSLVRAGPWAPQADREEAAPSAPSVPLLASRSPQGCHAVRAKDPACRCRGVSEGQFRVKSAESHPVGSSVHRLNPHLKVSPIFSLSLRGTGRAPHFESGGVRFLLRPSIGTVLRCRRAPGQALVAARGQRAVLLAPRRPLAQLLAEAMECLSKGASVTSGRFRWTERPHRCVPPACF